jgi:hypothetical protein
MSSIAHNARTLRARAPRKALRWLGGAILVAGVTIVLALAIGGSGGDRTAPAASPSQSAPPPAGIGATNGRVAGPTMCCGHRP